MSEETRMNPEEERLERVKRTYEAEMAAHIIVPRSDGLYVVVRVPTPDETWCSEETKLVEAFLVTSEEEAHERIRTEVLTAVIAEARGE